MRRRAFLRRVDPRRPRSAKRSRRWSRCDEVFSRRRGEKTIEKQLRSR